MAKPPKVETNKARQAFEDYYAMGAGRSLADLAEQYRARTKPAPPTRQLTVLKVWSSTFGWQERIARRDDELAAEQLQAMKKAARENGYAIIEKRLKDLNELAELLLSEIKEEKKRWLPDVKQIGQGDSAQKVDIVRFNAPLIREYRETLGDMAAELGQRRPGLELTGKDGGAIQAGWEGEIIELLRRGKLTPAQLVRELGDDDARPLIVAAGLAGDAGSAPDSEN